MPDCTLCHESAGSSVRNPFGQQVESVLWDGDNPMIPADEFEAGLPEALMQVESDDADGDGYPNFDEWMAGSWPGDANSVPGQDACEGNPDKSAWRYDVCAFDPAFTYRKVLLDFCGHSPTYDEVQDVLAAADPVARVHEALDTCLDSEFWRGPNGVLWQLAHKKIQPAPAIKSGDDPGGIPLGDYEDDYNLFVWTQTDGRDARDLLLAQYFVRRIDGEQTTYELYPEAEQAARSNREAQVTAPQRRAGMVTTRWFIGTNTMFTALPRTTAAQAYRSYLGLDIAKMQGLVAPAGFELIDYDSKGITQTECATCHEVLDPLTYPFSRYRAIDGGIGNIGEYDPNRLASLDDVSQPDVDLTPEEGFILGQQVDDLVQWGEVAANSDEFAAAIVQDYWTLLVGEAPRPYETEAFADLWQRFKNDLGHDVEAMLHELIDTEAYSVP